MFVYYNIQFVYLPIIIVHYNLWFFYFRIQLYDLLGAALNENSHKAAMETLVFTNTDDIDKVERYLWGASMIFNPKIEIIKSTCS